MKSNAKSQHMKDKNGACVDQVGVSSPFHLPLGTPWESVKLLKKF